MSSTAIPKVRPAQLSFLAIYNPSLGTSDETFHDQIVFYHSRAAKARTRLNAGDTRAERDLRDRENEKLRQVGLAQGMVAFARSFSNGDAVSSVETQKSRIVLHELEQEWWILASIDLTQLPAATNSTSRRERDANNDAEPAVEYSSREVSPPDLLLQQLIRAYYVFLLHHGSNLAGLFTKTDRTKFCHLLDKFWTRFANNWDVLLHGSPSVDIFGGLKLAAGGELGMGVGEEEWGSGERDVLEDFARRTDGLVDVLVSRFGEPSSLQNPKRAAVALEKADISDPEPWLGSGKYGDAADGVVFSGVGALTRRSLRDVSLWVEDIYTYGEYAYGVKDNPSTDRKRRRRRNPKASTSGLPSREISRAQSPNISDTLRSSSNRPPGIPPPIVSSVEASLDKATDAVDRSGVSVPTDAGAVQSEPFMASLSDAETWMKYLTLGYGTAWGGKRPQNDTPVLSEGEHRRQASPTPAMRHIDPEPEIDHTLEKLKGQVQQENSGYFIVGLQGDMEDEDVDDENDDGAWNNRIPLRTLHVELATQIPETPIEDETPDYEKELTFKSSETVKLSRLRPVVYVHRPFIYTFLFHHRTGSLSLASFYRNLHTYFSPLHHPLSNSTSPDKVAARISAASNPYTTISSTTSSGPNTQPIYDLVYDPRTLTVHSSLPNIPEPGTLTSEGLSTTFPPSSWSRVDALNVHSQILATVSETRRTLFEIERTCKTSRNWWVVWMRLPPSDDVADTTTPTAPTAAATEADPADPANPPNHSNTATSEPDTDTAEFNIADLREAFLVRHARDSNSISTKSSGGSRISSGMWRLGGGLSTEQKMGGAAAGWGPKGLAEGIGIDARKYVEGLLSLNR